MNNKPHYNTDLSIIGNKYGRLMVLEYSHSKRTGKHTSLAMFKCRCDCGKIVFSSGNNIRTGHAKSCGCYLVDWIKKNKTTHGCSNKRIYNIWQGMKDRCYNKNEKIYKYYGERGVSICAEWMVFVTFNNWAMANGYKDNLSIERIDVNGNYEPSNCKWATRKEQAANTRRNHVVTAFGKSEILQYWADRLGVHNGIIIGRLKRGWSAEDAVSLFPSLNRKRKPKITK